MRATTERLRNSCDQCAHSKIKCDGGRPNCRNCCRRDRSCSYSYVRQAGRPRRAGPPRPNTGNYEPTESIGDDAATVSPGQYRPRSASDTSSTTPAIATAPDISNQLNYDQPEAVLDGKTLYYDGYDGYNSLFRSDLPLEITGLRLGLMDSLAPTQIQHPISTDYLSSVPIESELLMAFDLPTHNQRNEDISMSIGQSSTVVGQGTPLSHQAVDGHHLEQCFKELLDNSRINNIVDHMVNPQLNGKCTSCSSESHDRCFHTRVNDDIGVAHLCQCPTLLNRLYVIVMDPRLSQPAKLIPLDLILFLEQALQDTKEAIRRCTICTSSRLPSGHGITLCLAADWVANCLRRTLDYEIDTFTGTRMPCSSWGCLEHQGAKQGELMEPHFGNTTNATPPLPSLDPRNSLQVGRWNAPREAWTLCVSVLLTSRIKRLQKMLFNVGTESLDPADGASQTAATKVGNEMAKDIHGKAEILLGMVKTWTSRCHSGDQCFGS